MGLIMGDPNRLRQVVWNILSNAVKFTPPGGRVEIELKRANNDAQITVSDTGQGISPEFLPNIFNRFQQADSSTTRKHGGLGLGLSIVRHIVELHGGTVKVESPGEGLGATFTVSIPLIVYRDQSPEGKREQKSAEMAIPENNPPNLGGMKLLVVDDDPDTLEMLEWVLAHYGAEVRICVSVEEALTTIIEWKPDLIISDIAMPSEDGYSLMRKVRAMDPEYGGRIPAIALTAQARIEDRRLVLEAGFQKYLSKPVDFEQLFGAVSELKKGG